MGVCREWFSSWRVNEVMEDMSRNANALAIDYPEDKIPDLIVAIQHGYRLALHDMYEKLNDDEATKIEDVFDLFGVEYKYED